MRIKPVSSTPNLGKLILLYSETGVGKSTSCFQSLPLPILYMCAEARNAELSALASGRNLKRGDFETPGDYVIAEYTQWDEYIKFLNDPSNFNMFASIVSDGETQLASNLAIEIEDQAFEYRAKSLDNSKGDKIIDKPLASQAKLSEEGYGTLASHMNRSIIALGKLTQAGKFVVINALLQSETRWDNTVYASPSFTGKKFGSDLPGACDLIGMVTSRYDNDGKLVFPPTVKFERGPSENFKCKWTGPKIKAYTDGGQEIPDVLMQMPLDFRIILGA